jgi:hypothetical protein
VSRQLLWLVFVELRQAWLRPGLAALAIAIAILTVALFAGQIGRRQAEILAGYDEAGAATFVAETSPTIKSICWLKRSARLGECVRLKRRIAA